MQVSFSRITHVLTRRSRTGQSIILIAFAFIALIAFVGIATDVAMLFVRFSTLRRAVDSAAIATAGQLRETKNFMALNAVAKEFVNIHGLDPQEVKVETCDTEEVNYIDKFSPGARTAQQAFVALTSGIDPVNGATVTKSELCQTNPQKFVRVTASLYSPTAFLALLGWPSVVLQTSSVAQTAVLDVAIVLDASLSQAFDTSNDQYPSGTDNLCYYSGTTDLTEDPAAGGAANGLKCGYDSIHGLDPNYFGRNADHLTGFKDFTNPSPKDVDGANHAILPPHSDTQRWGVDLCPWNATGADCTKTDSNTGLNYTAPAIRDECYMDVYAGNGYSDSNYSWAGCCNDPTTQSDQLVGSTQQSGYDGTTYQVLAKDTSAASPKPGDVHRPALIKGFNPDPNWYLYDADFLPESVIMTSGQNPFSIVGSHPAPAAKVLSGQPDGNFSDLICRPFKDVRDAARRFIRRLDFARGDRAILVTFDSGARAISPYPVNPYGDQAGTTIPILTDEVTAVRTLNMQVGVEVSEVGNASLCPSFNALKGPPLYNPGNIKAQFVPGGTGPFPQKPVAPGFGLTPGTYGYSDFFYNVNPYDVYSYWTVPQCSDTNTGGGIQAATSAIVSPNWIRRESVWVMIVLSDGYPNRTPPVGVAGSSIYPAVRNWLQVRDVNGGGTDYNYPTSLTSPLAGDQAMIQKYCDRYEIDTTTGATLLDGDGNPIPNTYYGQQPQWCITGLQSSPELPSIAPDNRYPAYSWGIQTQTFGDQVGSFGFCPWWTFCPLGPTPGTASNPLCAENNLGSAWMSTANHERASSPVCSDTDPDSRHFCMDGTGRINPGTLTNTQNAGPTGIENDPKPSDYYCDPHYDADDYARDRADFAGLVYYMDKSINETDTTHFAAAKRGNFIAIYSIFFDHKKNGSSTQLLTNILGVKLLRYFADVGDNGFVDNHLQHWYRDVRDGVILPGTFTHPTNPNAANTWRNPPTGMNEAAVYWDATSTTHNTNKTGPCCGLTQPTPPSYNGKNPDYIDNAKYNYPTDEDPCAAFDYNEMSPAPVTNDANYEQAAKTSCGQYFYVDTADRINQAFTAIAGRLFTRLSR